ncbi:MAG: hypothetical protein JHD35_13945 [Sphingopyxis sp.]|nr:hypothetical protein [Sphingopyxis sp.]
MSALDQKRWALVIGMRKRSARIIVGGRKFSSWSALTRLGGMDAAGESSAGLIWLNMARLVREQFFSRDFEPARARQSLKSVEW